VLEGEKGRSGGSSAAHAQGKGRGSCAGEGQGGACERRMRARLEDVLDALQRDGDDARVGAGEQVAQRLDRAHAHQVLYLVCPVAQACASTAQVWVFKLNDGQAMVVPGQLTVTVSALKRCKQCNALDGRLASTTACSLAAGSPYLDGAPQPLRNIW
jgi:hypothetical protein